MYLIVLLALGFAQKPAIQPPAVKKAIQPGDINGLREKANSQPQEKPVHVMDAVEYCEDWAQKRADLIEKYQSDLDALKKKDYFKKLPPHRQAELKDSFLKPLKKLREDKELHFQTRDFFEYESIGDLGAFAGASTGIQNREYRSLFTIDRDLVVIARPNRKAPSQLLRYVVRGLPVGAYEKKGTIVPLSGAWIRIKPDERVGNLTYKNDFSSERPVKELPMFEAWPHEDEARALWKKMWKEEREREKADAAKPKSP